MFCSGPWVRSVTTLVMREPMLSEPTGAPVFEFHSSRSEKLACSALSPLYPGVEALARSFASWSWRTCSASIPDAAM